MGTGTVPRPGLTVFGLWSGLVFLTGGLATGCGNSGAADAPGTGRTVATPASARATPPEELCAQVVAYWSRRVMDGGTYGDYQTMGLSNGQYEILRTVVDAARAVKKRQGARAANELIEHGARDGCAGWYRRGGPSKGPWQ